MFTIYDEGIARCTTHEEIGLYCVLCMLMKRDGTVNAYGLRQFLITVAKPTIDEGLRGLAACGAIIYTCKTATEYEDDEYGTTARTVEKETITIVDSEAYQQELQRQAQELQRQEYERRRQEELSKELPQKESPPTGERTLVSYVFYDDSALQYRRRV